MKLTKKAMRAAAKSLIAARDLMNDGGRHWIKGAERRMVNPDTHKPGDRVYTQPFSGGEPAFCSIGALQETKADGLAYIALAEAARPGSMAVTRKRAEKFVDDEIRGGWRLESERAQVIHDILVGEARGWIIDFNDTPSRKWRDVRDAFTQAAQQLKEKAGGKS